MSEHVQAGQSSTRARTAYVLAEVAAERDRQDAKWGGPQHDDTHSPGDFCGFVLEHASRAGSAAMGVPEREFDDYRRQMLRVAALAVAAIEHYDHSWKPKQDRAEHDRMARQVEARLVDLYGPDESKWPRFQQEGR